MENLSTAEIAELNKKDGAGIYFEAIIVTRDRDADPQVKDYFANFERQISFDGKLYEILPMAFSGARKSTAMEVPSNEVTVFNPGPVGGIIESYINDENIDVEGSDIELLYLRYDRLTQRVVKNKRERLQIQVIAPDPTSATATIFATLNLRVNDIVPKGTMETSRYPGIPANAVRTGT